MKRKLKIYSQTEGNNKYQYVPTIILKGKWLEKVGFGSGNYIDVEVDGDKIVLTKVPEAKKDLQEKIDELTPEQKEKLSKMIDEL